MAVCVSSHTQPPSLVAGPGVGSGAAAYSPLIRRSFAAYSLIFVAFRLGSAAICAALKGSGAKRPVAYSVV